MAADADDLQLDIDLAAARKRKAEMEADVDLGAVGEGAEAGAAASALALPAIAWYARSRNLGVGPEMTPGARAPGALPVNAAGEFRPRRPMFSPHGGKGEAVAAALSTAAREIGESAARNPKSFAAAEIAAGAGAGAGAELMHQETRDQPPLVQDAASLAGSLVAGGTMGPLPSTAVNAVRRFLRWGMTDLPQLISALPVTGIVARRIPGIAGGLERRTEEASADRASAALRSRVADPEAAAAAAMEGPAGVTPARRTGEEGLMGVEARIAEEDPVFRKGVEDDLNAAITKTQGDLRDLYATPRGKQDWEKAVIQRVAAPGATLEGETPTDLLDSAKDSFEPLYAPYKQWPAKARLLTPTRKTPLLVMLRNAMNSRTTMAGDDTRRSVGRWLEGKMTSLARRTDRDGNLTTGDLLALRSDIRTASREASDSLTGKDKSELLDLAEDRVNQVLRTWLPPDMWSGLAGVDRQYGAFKTVAAAVRRSKDRELTPDNLLAELRYGGRQTQELRSAAQSGRSVEELLGDPNRARVVASQLTAPDLANMRGSYAHSLMDRASVVGEDGGRAIDGVKLQKLLSDNYDVGRSIGMSHEELGRLDNMATQLRNMQKPSPEAVAKIMTDGPGDILQLATTLAASKVSSEYVKATGSGAGSLAVTGFLSRYYRKLLNALTGDRAVQLLIDASRDPELYSALLLRKSAAPVAHRDASRKLNAWLATVAAPQAADVGTDAIDDLRREADSLRSEE